jgi:hypothetical protein
VKKELHLQQMTLVVSGLYVLCWLAVVALRPLMRAGDDAFTMLTMIYGFLIASLAGAFASAGERQLGTLDWQALLPVAARTQWAVKLGVLFGLVLLLAVGLPLVLASLNPALNPKQLLRPEVSGAVIVMAACSLYVSSLCSTGLWALVMALPAAAATAMFAMVVGERVGAASYALSARMLTATGPAALHLGRFGMTRLATVLTVLIISAVIAVALRFAFANHRAAERSAGATLRQVMVLAASITAGAMILPAAMAFVR